MTSIDKVAMPARCIPKDLAMKKAPIGSARVETLLYLSIDKYPMNFNATIMQMAFAQKIAMPKQIEP
jgi:hypothetical protein